MKIRGTRVPSSARTQLRRELLAKACNCKHADGSGDIATEGMALNHVDVNRAFIQAAVEEEIFVESKEISRFS